MDNSGKQPVPGVVVWSAGLYGTLLFSTGIVWYLETCCPHGEGHHLYEPMVDGLKVGLGALIGVLSQWAGQFFRQGRKDEEPAPPGNPAPPSPGR